MASYINEFLFGFYPYLCMVVFFFGSWVRFDRSQYTWRSQSSQFLRRRQLIWGSILFHVGILLLFFGHFFGLLTPPEVYTALGITVKGKQLLAVIAGGMRTPFLLDRFPDLDPELLQDPANVARAIRGVLQMPDEAVVAEITVLPVRETSWR